MVVLVIVVLVMLVFVLLTMRMPGAITGGADVTTAGGVPMGAGTIMP